jgi:ribosomal-protein-alanine N-acetyltransferase
VQADEPVSSKTLLYFNHINNQGENKMTIKTDRLELIPLTLEQLKLWVENIAALEKELSAVYMAEPMEGFFLDVVKGQLKITEKYPHNYLWHSFWLLLRKKDRIIVGSADFKDIPDDKGIVEIGYGLGKAFEHNGYMTEAVKAMCTWVLNQSRVTTIIAETDLDGFASQRILKRCGFENYKQGGTLWWRIQVT